MLCVQTVLVFLSVISSSFALHDKSSDGLLHAFLTAVNETLHGSVSSSNTVLWSHCTSEYDVMSSMDVQLTFNPLCPYLKQIYKAPEDHVLNMECSSFQVHCGVQSFTVDTGSSSSTSCGVAFDPVTTTGNHLSVLHSNVPMPPAYTCKVTAKPLCKCGVKKVDTKIVNGVETFEGEIPWQVEVLRWGRLYCGGVLIHEEWVLSAAHCFHGKSSSDFTIKLGEHIRSANSINERTPGIRKIYVHPDYRRHVFQNDITLIHIERLTFTDYIQPACLPFKFADHSLDNEKMTASGWGTTSSNGPTSDILLKVELDSISNEECEDAFRPGVIVDSSLCAMTPTKDSCQGDSGGPLTLERGNVISVVGLVSFGIGCAKPDNPGVYARVSSFLPWIQNVTNADFCVPA